jgi:hypothetical protein
VRLALTRVGTWWRAIPSWPVASVRPRNETIADAQGLTKCKALTTLRSGGSRVTRGPDVSSGSLSERRTGLLSERRNRCS